MRVMTMEYGLVKGGQPCAHAAAVTHLSLRRLSDSSAVAGGGMNKPSYLNFIDIINWNYSIKMDIYTYSKCLCQILFNYSLYFHSISYDTSHSTHSFLLIILPLMFLDTTFGIW